jgi:hypothetical protein
MCSWIQTAWQAEPGTTWRRGRAVMTIPAEAAELLGLSRPFVAHFPERGDLPSELLPDSRHRGIRLEDVLTFQTRREPRAEGLGRRW